MVKEKITQSLQGNFVNFQCVTIKTALEKRPQVGNLILQKKLVFLKVVDSNFCYNEHILLRRASFILMQVLNKV